MCPPPPKGIGESLKKDWLLVGYAKKLYLRLVLFYSTEFVDLEALSTDAFRG